MFKSNSNSRDPIANRVRESAENLQSVRVTKNREYFVLDRLAPLSSRALDKSDQSGATLPFLEKTMQPKSMADLTKLNLNKTLTVTMDFPVLRDSSLGWTSIRIEKEGPSRQVYLKTEKLFKDKTALNCLLDPIVVSQINKNKKIIDNLLDKERQKTVQVRMSQEYSNVSFFRNNDSRRVKTLIERSKTPTYVNENDQTQTQRMLNATTINEIQPDISKSNDGLEEHNHLGSTSIEFPLNYNYSSIIDRLATKNHPNSFEEVLPCNQLAAVAISKRWHLPSMDCMKLSQYAVLSHEDKQKLYSMSYSNFEHAHPTSKFTEALKVSKEKLTKYFKKLKPAEDRLEMVALQKWYLETMMASAGPTEQDLQTYFSNKALVFSYTFQTLASHLRLIRKEAADLLAAASDDLFRFVDEIAGRQSLHSHVRQVRRHDGL